MSLLLLFPSQAAGEAELRNSAVPLIINHQYRLTFRVRSSLIQTFEILIRNSTGASISYNATRDILAADTWQTIKVEFTAVATDPLSILGITPTSLDQSFYVDKFNMIDLTVERKEYRIMRIQGSVLPGSFVQILTLREKTANETA
jgi:hypothetical protein